MNAIMTDQIEEQVIKIVSEEVDIAADKISRDSVFETDLPMDSLGKMELAMKIEETFGLSISDDAANSFKTVGDIIDYVRKQTNDGKRT
jgi:acyl carrier protein